METARVLFFRAGGSFKATGVCNRCGCQGSPTTSPWPCGRCWGGAGSTLQMRSEEVNQRSLEHSLTNECTLHFMHMEPCISSATDNSPPPACWLRETEFVANEQAGHTPAPGCLQSMGKERSCRNKLQMQSIMKKCRKLLESVIGVNVREAPQPPLGPGRSYASRRDER